MPLPHGSENILLLCFGVDAGIDYIPEGTLIRMSAPVFVRPCFQIKEPWIYSTLVYAKFQRDLAY